MSTSIFLTGATGYIGGSVLTRLLKHKLAANSTITILVRSADKANIFADKVGVSVVVGSYSDLDLLTKCASEADITITTADCNDEPANEAILRGLQARHSSTGKAPILIHTSGTGVLTDFAAGLHGTDNIYSDMDIPHIESLPLTQMHRPVDVAIVKADTDGYAKTYIILPSTIWGIVSSTAQLVSLGLQNPHSQQIPGLIKVSLERGKGAMVGKGENFWPNVNVEDIADLFILVLDAALDGKAAHGREGYYFGENGEHKLYEVYKSIAESLYEAGKVQSPEPVSFTEEEVKKYGDYMGTNSRCKAQRSRALGWKPSGGSTDEMLASIKPECKAILEAGGDVKSSWR